MEAGEKLAIAELLRCARLWSVERLVNEIIEAEYYDTEHGWTENIPEMLESMPQTELAAHFLPIYEKQLRNMDDLADEYAREILKLK